MEEKRRTNTAGLGSFLNRLAAGQHRDGPARAAQVRIQRGQYVLRLRERNAEPIPSYRPPRHDSCFASTAACPRQYVILNQADTAR